MGIRILFKNSPPAHEVMAKAKQLGVSLGKEQTKFVEDHATHGGLSIQDNKVSCRTCKAST